MFDRRHFLRLSTVAASAGAVKCIAAESSDTPSRPAHLGSGAPRRIIHMVADGTSLGTWSCGDQLSRLETGHGLAWFDIWRDPEACTCLMDMRSLDSLVTDSAAASSSWGSGSRVRNGVLNVTSTGRPLTPLMALFGEAGWKRGLVTTTEITHATPAGFTVAVDSRAEGETIAQKYLDRKLDVFLGGARDHFDGAKRKDKRDLWIQFAAAGYHVAKSKADFEKAPEDRPWLGTFASGHLPFSIDQAQDKSLQANVPTLREMTDRALARLSRHDRFLLQIEGGRVDHACHNNDAAGALRDLLAFDQALVRVLEYRRQHPDTLVVVTTDHGNANLGLNGIGTSYRDSSHSFRHVARVRASFPEILKRLKAARNEADAIDALADTTGYKVPKKKLAQFLPFLTGRGSTLFDQMNSEVAALGQLLANHIGIGFVGTTHTSDYVPLVALGPGSDRFRGLIRNVDVFRTYTDLARIDYRNPEEKLLADNTANPHAEDHRSYVLA
ncbi:MAG: alkaline phosphatase [Verrucomicrobiales bacterium]|nr:alkaline phosphatase [Verrucomicrobiales bacterium]